MADKEQIIIDGVDVKNCKGIDLGLFPLAKCKFLKFKTSDGGIAGIWCSDHTNCYYKQLARKTQECKKLNDKIIDMNSIIEDAAINLGNKDFTLYNLPFEIKKLRQRNEENRILRRALKTAQKKANEYYFELNLLKQQYRTLLAWYENTSKVIFQESKQYFDYVDNEAKETT